MAAGLPFFVFYMRLKMEHKNWNGFNVGEWQNKIDVRDFIQKNYSEYKGGAEFLSPATERTKELMNKLNGIFGK